ncbi:hypothetical protein J6590_027651 [Homalodisca vitripennis]|nr:hypothetical protein J6590_027651 [Homalodisca vitripennis]
MEQVKRVGATTVYPSALFSACLLFLETIYVGSTEFVCCCCRQDTASWRELDNQLIQPASTTVTGVSYACADVIAASLLPVVFELASITQTYNIRFYA